MKDNYDFSKGKKNPYVNKLENGYTVTIHYDFIKGESREGKTDKEITEDKRPPAKTN